MIHLLNIANNEIVLEEQSPERLLLFTICLAAFIVVLVIQGINMLVYQKRYQRKQKALIERQYNLEKLREEYYRKSAEYVEENDAKIAALEEMLNTSAEENGKLQSEIERLRCCNRIAKIDMENDREALSKVRESAIYRQIQEQIIHNGGRHLNEEEWKELAAIIDDAFCNFSERLLKYCQLTPQEFRVCLLLKIGIKPNDISTLTAHSKQSISTTRNRLFKKVFGEKGSGKDWDEFIYSL